MQQSSYLDFMTFGRFFISEVYGAGDMTGQLWALAALLEDSEFLSPLLFQGSQYTLLAPGQKHTFIAYANIHINKSNIKF